MNLEHATVTEQLDAFARMIQRNPVVVAILQRMPSLQLADCWLAAGGLFQTVWNVLCDRDPGAGILDYDLNYFDDTDLTWEAEDEQIARTTDLLGGIEAPIQVRNEARVHLWYEAKFGVVCPPYRSTRHAISTFPNCSSCIAVRPKHGGLEVFAPFGLSDLLAMRTRPNPVLAPATVYETKTLRWLEEWPQLTVLPWPTAVGR